MANINWNDPFFLDLATLRPASSGIPLPTYGNFGGAGYSQGVFVVDPDPARFDPVPVDDLDHQFMRHDQASAAAATTSEQAAADLTLIYDVERVSQGELDPEARLYGGAVILAMIEQLAVNDSLDLLPPRELAGVAGDAVQDIGQGFASLGTSEIVQAVGWLSDVLAVAGVETEGALGAVESGLSTLPASHYDWLIH